MSKTSRTATTWIVAAIGLVAVPAVTTGRPPMVGVPAAERQAMVDKAVAYLKTKQNKDGSFAPRLAGPGVSAVVAAALLRNGVKPDDPLLAKTLKYLEKKVKPDGGVYDRGLANYTTSVAIVAFTEANTGGKYDALIRNATKFLRDLQYGSDGSLQPAELKFGGVGYDGKSRPDMSNTQYFLDALHGGRRAQGRPGRAASLGVRQPLPEPARPRHNDQPFAAKATEDDKGGLVYNPIDADEQPPRRHPQGGLRSAGAMTYAGLKSFLYAGVVQGRPARQGGDQVDSRPLHARREPRHGSGRPVLLLPHLRQGDDRVGRGPVQGRQGHGSTTGGANCSRRSRSGRNRTAAGPTPATGPSAKPPRAGDRVRPAGPELLRAGEIAGRLLGFAGRCVFSMDRF